MDDFTPDYRACPYSMAKSEKDKVLTERLLFLTEYHRQHCAAYKRMTDAMGYSAEKINHYSKLPFLPVSLFKELRLSSIDDSGESYKVVTSSGTTGQKKSQIILDGETRTAQQMALAAIGGSFLGKKRIPMLVIDCPATVRDRNFFSARTSGIVGFSIFGEHRTFALRDDMSLDMDAVNDFAEKYGDSPFLIFGFTFMVWKYFCRELEKTGNKINFKNGIMLHGGGWKKLTAEAVSADEFKARLKGVCGIEKVYDYYGMAEQTGSIFMTCECGHLHASDFSGVIFRRGKDFSICEKGEKGIIQVLSVLPRSYPGHSLITEDEGVLLGVDDCPCGRKGAYFSVSGRIKNAELRGCSDTYAAGI